MKISVGKVEDGTGRASAGMPKVAPDEWAPLGYIPHPGTLNIRVGPAQKGKVRKLPHVVVVSDALDSGQAEYRPVQVRGVDCHARFSRDKGTVELVAPFHLRDTLGLVNGDRVEIHTRSTATDGPEPTGEPGRAVRLSVAVMAHPKRAAFVDELVGQLDTDPTVVWDERNDRWDTGRRSMLAYDPDATHHLVIQDDAVPCQDLCVGVEAAVAHIPADSPLVLYVGTLRPYPDAVARLTAAATPDTSFLQMASIHWGVGIVLPTHLIDEAIGWGDDHPEIQNYDRRLGLWAESRNLDCFYTWPSLVDHRDSPSLVPGRAGKRHARTFLGADVSAADCRWDGDVVTMPELETAPPEGPGDPAAGRVRYRHRNGTVRAVNLGSQAEWRYSRSDYWELIQ